MSAAKQPTDTGTSLRTLIVNYHYCLSQHENPYLARTAVDPKAFAAQMQTLANARLAQNGAAGPHFLVTFDDGTSDIYRNALPVLRRYAMPAVFFVCSQPIIERRLLNVTKVHLLQGKLGFETFKTRFMAALAALEAKGAVPLDDPQRIGLGRIYRYDTEEVREFKLLMNARLPLSVVTAILDQMFEPEFGSQAEAAEKIYMSLDDLARCRDQGVGIGLHTHGHVMLSRLSAQEQEREIAVPREFFADKLGLDGTLSLSYPFGIPGTWNALTKFLLARHAVDRAYTLGRQVYDPGLHRDPFEIPRFDVNDVFDRNHLLREGLRA